MALVLTLAGCALVVRLVPLGDEHISWFGLLVGLGSGFGYALYSIFGKHALKKYDSLTVITHTFVFASLFMLPFNAWSFSANQLASMHTLALILGLGFFPTALAYGLYTRGLSMIESGRASVTATIEPVVATMVGVVIFNEILTGYQLSGMILVIAAVVLIQLRKKQAVR